MDDSKINFKNVIYGCNLFHFHTNRRYEVSIQKRCTYHEKVLRSLLAITLLLGIVSTTALAAEPRWRNVASISPSMSAYDGSYTSAIIALEGTTKIECTLTLYEKGFFGNYTQVSQVSETYNGPRHEFVGYYAIKSGTTYKLNTTAKVTRNGVTETVSTDFEKRC